MTQNHPDHMIIGEQWSDLRKYREMPDIDFDRLYAYRIERLREQGLGDLPVVVGGIIPDDDAETLRRAGVRRVYTPKDFDLTRIADEIVDVVSESHPAA